eukprot:2498596-Rhodomonas_salina.3
MSAAVSGHFDQYKTTHSQYRDLKKSERADRTSREQPGNAARALRYASSRGFVLPADHFWQATEPETSGCQQAAVVLFWDCPCTRVIREVGSEHVVSGDRGLSGDGRVSSCVVLLPATCFGGSAGLADSWVVVCMRGSMGLLWAQAGPPSRYMCTAGLARKARPDSVYWFSGSRVVMGDVAVICVRGQFVYEGRVWLCGSGL